MGVGIGAVRSGGFCMEVGAALLAAPGQVVGASEDNREGCPYKGTHNDWGC